MTVISIDCTMAGFSIDSLVILIAEYHFYIIQPAKVKNIFLFVTETRQTSFLSLAYPNIAGQTSRQCYKTFYGRKLRIFIRG
jgi:hypothetical protein